MAGLGRSESKSLESIAGYAWTFNFLVSNEGSESLEGMVVSKDYFRVSGLQPLLGRTFLESETGVAAGAGGPDRLRLVAAEVQRRPAIVGKTMRMSRRETPPTIIGVMRPGVRFLPSPGAAKEPNYNVDAQVDFWMPGPAERAEVEAAGLGRGRRGCAAG